MAGGTYTDYNKILPGVYIRYKTKPDLSASVGERGTVAIARQLSWGKENEIIEISDLTKLTDSFGYDISSDQALFIREITRGSNLTSGANKILLWRISNTDAKEATVTVGDLTVTALYKGVRGNDISIIITPDTASKFANENKYAIYTIDTYLDGSIVDTQTVGTDENTPAKIEDLVSNNFVKFSGTGEFTASSGTYLTGGADGSTIKTTSHSDFLSILGKKDFNVVIYDGSDVTTKSVYNSFIKRMATEEGKYACAVMADYKSADNEFVISVKNGVTIETGATLTKEQTTWWVGGASAGANYNESLTYHTYPGATDLETEYEQSELKDILNDGEFVFMKQDGEIKVVSDINTFTSFTPTKGKALRKNRVMRTIFQICNDLYLNISKTYIGKIDVNAAGVNMIKGFTIQYLEGLQSNRALQNFTMEDVNVEQLDVDSMKMDLYLQPVDSLEKIYVEILVA